MNLPLFAQAEGMMAIFIPIIAVTLSLSIPIVAIIVEYKQKKNKAEVIKKAIENGVPIDNLQLDVPKPRIPYRSGMVNLAVGIGVALFGVLLGTIGPDIPGPAMASLVGIGAIIGLVGLALLINDKMNYDRFFKNGD